MKGRKGKSDGGVNQAKQEKAPSDVYQGKGSPVASEAKERKSGGKIEGAAKMNAGRAARKSGGRAPGLFSAAASGKQPSGHKTYAV